MTKNNKLKETSLNHILICQVQLLINYLFPISAVRLRQLLHFYWKHYPSGPACECHLVMQFSGAYSVFALYSTLQLCFQRVYYYYYQKLMVNMWKVRLSTNNMYSCYLDTHVYLKWKQAAFQVLLMLVLLTKTIGSLSVFLRVATINNTGQKCKMINSISQ